MVANRVLFLGTTGVNKSKVMESVAAWWKDTFLTHPSFVDFEPSYLWPQPGSTARRNRFLEESVGEQRNEWREAWKALMAERFPTPSGTSPIYLGMHACYVTEQNGARVACCPVQVAHDFKPDLVVTLIADVYDMWWRTESRAAGKTAQGRPTLEQLLTARRFELCIGDLIALAASEDPDRNHGDQAVRNFMVSVNHPLETLGNLIAHPHDAKVAYLSFPISQPRDAEEDRLSWAKEAVSTFVHEAYLRQKSDHKLVVQCPLTIDEVPFAKLAAPQTTTAEASTNSVDTGLHSEDAEKDARLTSSESSHGKGRRLPVSFDRSTLRWSLNELWPSKDGARILEQPEAGSVFPVEQLDRAAGIIWADISWRDYRMVDQADFLLVLSPLMYRRPEDKVEMAGSVREEIDRAISRQRPVFIYQDPLLDPDDVVGGQLGVPRGGHRATMAANRQKNNLVWKEDLSSLLNVLAEYEEE